MVTNQLQPHNMPDRTAKSVQILGNDWLTDESVDFYYQLLANKITNKTQISFMASVVSQAVKCLNDFSELLDEVDLRTKSHILIPVNDSPAVDMPGGSGSH